MTKMDNNTDPLTVAEYFAGIGLVRMGLEQNGWQVIWANDISSKKKNMYISFFPNGEADYLVDNIFNIDPKQVPRTLLATCSFPCINLSLAGNMEGINGRHSSAFWGFIRILDKQKESGNAPPLILVENVPGWLSSNSGDDFRVTVKALNDIGYTCDVFVLDALRFTPQSRLRVFLVGILSSSMKGGLEKILDRSKSLLSPTLRKAVTNNRNLNWFFTELPDPPQIMKQGLAEIVEDIPETDSRWWKANEVYRHLEMMDSSHRKRVEDLIQRKGISYRTFYRRIRNKKQRAEVRPDDIAGCLRTATGGSGKQFLIKAGNGKVMMRTLTPREYARLQGVPDKYQINGNGVQALTGFGDAVCVPVISWIAQHALKPLANEILQVKQYHA